MFFRNKIIQKKTVAMLLLPFAFLLTRCAKDFDAPTISPAPKVAEEVVSGLKSPFALAIVPDLVATASVNVLVHSDLLVANFGDHTITRVHDSSIVTPPFATPSTENQLHEPTGIAFDIHGVNGNIYISNFKDAPPAGTIGGSITVLNADGTFKRVINDPLFKGARGIVYDTHHSDDTKAIFFVSNMTNNTILKIEVTTADTTVRLYADLSFWGLAGKNPTQLAISPIEPHNLYAANTGLRPPLPDGDLQSPLGRTISIIPTTVTVLPVPNTDIRLILAGEVSGPLPLGFDDEGRLFTSDHAKGTLVMIDPQIGLRLASVETGEANMYGMAVGEGGIYLTAVKGGRIIEVASSLLTGEADGGHQDGDGHLHP